MYDLTVLWLYLRSVQLRMQKSNGRNKEAKMSFTWNVPVFGITVKHQHSSHRIIIAITVILYVHKIEVTRPHNMIHGDALCFLYGRLTASTIAV